MPPSRSKTELLKLLDQAERPIYVLDDELRIVFLNRTCRQWLGPVADELLGRRCKYHSTDLTAGVDALAAGLCPPPWVLEGKPASTTVGITGEGGKPIERRATFTPLGWDGHGVLAVVAVVDAADSPLAATHADADADSSALHERIRRYRQRTAGRWRADRLIGHGPAMRLARRQAELAAANRCGTTIVGPTGSGRRHLAAAIHFGVNPPGQNPAAAQVPQATAEPGAFVPLDCALLGDDVLDGAAAAVARSVAVDGSASPCTLLLHCVDELSGETQSRLADFLVRRAAGWRLIGTAAEPLDELSRRGKFSADLAALLGTIVIVLPPLASRRDDLPALAQMFLEDCNAGGGRQIAGFSPEALERLDAYPWPGNLDELAQVVFEAHRRATGTEIAPQDLPEQLRLIEEAGPPRREEETIELDEYLGRVERELLRRALARAKGNKARAARLLGITRPRLLRRLAQLGLE
jgi:DNA-binding NtrC family response regulator